MFGKSKINQGSLTYINDKKNMRHPFTHLTIYVVYTNALKQKEKKNKKHVQEMHKVSFSVTTKA